VDLFWVTHQLAVVTRPLGGDRLAAELRRLRSDGIDVLVSCLTRDEEAESGLLDEETLAVAAGMGFVRTTIDDHSIPVDGSIDPALDELNAALQAGRRVAVHCWMGLGRSPTVVSALLIADGKAADEAIGLVSLARGTTVPETEAQRAWLNSQVARTR
jgi:protein-tyrosine phosphatase